MQSSRKSFSSSKSYPLATLIFKPGKTLVETKEGEIFYVRDFDDAERVWLGGDTVAYKLLERKNTKKLREVIVKHLVKRSEGIVLAKIVTNRSKKSLQLLDGFGQGRIKTDASLEHFNIGDILTIEPKGPRDIRIGKALGNEKDPYMQEKIVFFQYGVTDMWDQAVLDAAKKIKNPTIQELHPTSRIMRELTHDLKDDFFVGKPFENTLEMGAIMRADMRNWYTMTIDGADAKDLDDAVSYAEYENGDMLLGVHIADVSSYVEAGSVLDREALRRATSIYTPGKVIPMLPERLSNELCSLHPGEPKSTLSILMRVDCHGNVRARTITPSLIQSQHRGVYDEVWRTFQKGDFQREHEHVIAKLFHLYDILKKRRQKEGKIIFETTEVYFDIGENGEIRSVRRRDRNDAHMLIEECMVLANEEVAKWCHAKKIPFLSRIHEAPSNENTEAIKNIISASLGKSKQINNHESALLSAHHPRHNQRGGMPHPATSDITPRDIRSFMDSLTTDEDRLRFSKLLLPKMSKAVYGDMTLGHFGLALAFYSHFTSPIRRYADLFTHRMIHEFLSKNKPGKNKKHTNYKDSTSHSSSRSTLQKIAKKISLEERKAEEIERTMDDIFSCRYMADKVGTEYVGQISGMSEFALYVSLENGIEGYVPLPRQTYVYDEILGAMQDKKGKIQYTIGEKLPIRIVAVRTSERRIEMGIINTITIKNAG